MCRSFAVKKLLVMTRTLLRYSQYRELYTVLVVGRQNLGERIWERKLGEEIG